MITQKQFKIYEFRRNNIIFQTIMGNKLSLNPAIPIFRQQEWEQIDSSSPQHPEYGYYKTLRHVESGQLVDEYELAYADQQDYRFYLNSFIWRLKQPEVVRTMYLKEEHRQQFCSKTYVVRVYIQHIETRVSDITDIPYPENLYVALSALDGFHKLYENLQYFRVEENQICVDENGHVRVWINSDLSKDYPNSDEEANGDGLHDDDTKMVQQIMTIVTDNTDKDSQPESLKGYFFDRGSKIGFEDAKIIISEYARKHNAQIPQCFESILEIYRKQDQSRQGEQYTNQNQSEVQQQYQQQNVVGIQRQDSAAFQRHDSASRQFQHHTQHRNQQTYGFQPWNHNKQNRDNSVHFRPLNPAEISYSDKNHRSIPNLHSFQNSRMPNNIGNKSIFSGPGVYSPKSNTNIRVISSPQHFISHQNQSPLGFQPSYSALPQNSNQQPLFRVPLFVPTRPQLIEQRNYSYSLNHNTSPRYRSLPPLPPFFLPPALPSHVQNQPFRNVQNQARRSRREQQTQMLKSNTSDKKISSPQINVVPPIGDQSVEKIGSSKHSHRQATQKSDSLIGHKQNPSFRNIQELDAKRFTENEHVSLSGAFSQSNNKSQHYSRSRDVLTEGNSYHKSAKNHGHEDFIRGANIAMHHRDSDKTFYYTLDTQQELDPQIAADLRKLML